MDMKIKSILNIKKMVAVSLVVFALTGCATSSSSDSVNAPSGFLPNYSILKPINSPPGMQIYSYKDPSFTRANYNSVIINPVTLYQTATAGGITQDQIQSAETSIQNGVAGIVSKSATVTTVPGPGVAQLSIAITGASVEGEGFKPRNVLPISAAIKLAKKATGNESKMPVLVVELQFTDSVSGKLLSETVSNVSGSQFTNNANTAQEFQQLAQQWVQQALQYSLVKN